MCKTENILGCRFRTRPWLPHCFSHCLAAWLARLPKVRRLAAPLQSGFSRQKFIRASTPVDLHTTAPHTRPQSTTLKPARPRVVIIRRRIKDQASFPQHFRKRRSRIIIMVSDNWVLHSLYPCKCR